MQTPSADLATLVVLGAPHMSVADAVDAAYANDLDLDRVRLSVESVDPAGSVAVGAHPATERRSRRE